MQIGKDVEIREHPERVPQREAVPIPNWPQREPAKKDNPMVPAVVPQKGNDGQQSVSI